MNDFTKEELEKICQFFNIAIEDFKEPDSTYKLRDKIQYMIDSYCDHEASDKYPNEFKWQLCSKCGKEYKLEKLD